MIISPDTIRVCLELFSSGVSVSILLPDGSTNLHAPDQARRFATAHQELLAALADDGSVSGDIARPEMAAPLA